MAHKRPHPTRGLVENEAALFSTTLSVIEAHGDRNFPNLCFVIGRLVATDRPVRTVEKDPLMAGDVVVVSVGKPFNPHQDAVNTPHGSDGPDWIPKHFRPNHLARFSGCELLNDDEIEARSFQILCS